MPTQLLWYCVACWRLADLAAQHMRRSTSSAPAPLPPRSWLQDAYGLEKLATEELCMHYDKDFGIDCRIARFHNIYGAGGVAWCKGMPFSTGGWRRGACKSSGSVPCLQRVNSSRRASREKQQMPTALPARPPLPAGPYGTWKGGREKAPAAFCRKALTAVGEVEMWGDGKQTRSFTFIDDCVEGILRITKSDFRQPLNLGSCEMVRGGGGAGKEGRPAVDVCGAVGQGRDRDACSCWCRGGAAQPGRAPQGPPLPPPVLPRCR